ncbi:MAG: chromosome segregation protein SMC [Halodesulfurarchaeum sp.]
MYIEEIVLENFKSFGRTTRIPFYEDFTTISGPNGTGKSNIIDAVLFALGLARTRGMRAQKLTDLIYNPNHEDEETEAGPQEAHVEVVLNNDDREVTRHQIVNAVGSEDINTADRLRVKRRVKQTEDNYYSYYYLNGRSVNLSDIQDLLSSAGITPEGYNVVMQGDVTGIINMTPHERREIIDEIAGVAEFDAKKEDAFEELEVVRDRIHEAQLRIEEKEERLEQLEDERETALEYQGLRDEKAEYESYVDAAELEEKRADLAETRADIEDRREQLEELEEELDERRGTVLRIEEDLEDLNAKIERKGEDEQLAIKREIEGIKGDISRLEDAIESAEERIEEAEKTRRQAFVKIDRKQEEIEELEADIRDIKVKKASLKTDRQEKEAEIEEIDEKIDAVDTEYEALTEELESRKADLEDAKDRRNDLQREKDRLIDEARRRSNEIADAKDAREEAKAELEDIEERIDELERELEKAEANREEIDEVVDDLAERKAAYQDEIDDVEDMLAEAKEEYARLEAQAEENGDSSFGRAVSTIRSADFDGVHGTIAELGGVDDEYATACETAAGGRMAHVVVDDDEVGQRCIEYLKSRNAGRATFLPISKMSVRRLPTPPDRPGVVDFAYNLVDFDEQYAPVFSYVLGDTLVVSDLDSARDLMGEYRLVTLDGDLIEKSGAMTGGSRSGSRYSFERAGKGKLQRVAERIENLEDERASLREDLRSTEERLENAREKRSDATERVRDIEAELDRAMEDTSDTEAEIEDLEATIEELEAEREDVDEAMSEIEDDIETVEDEITDIQAEIDDIEAELADSEIPDLTEKKDELRAEIQDIDENIDELDGELNSRQLEKQYAEEAIDDLHDDVETAQNQKAEKEERIEELEETIAEKEEDLEEKREEVERLEEELAKHKDEREAIREDLKEAREARDEKKQEVEELRNRIESLENAEARLEAEVEELEESVESYDQEEIPDLDEVERNIRRLERQMAELEPVNMKAIDEYDRVESALESLEGRKDELVEERNGIQDRIQYYEEQKRETFMDAYTGINEHFQSIFTRLSDGTGELVLEDEQDPFEGGLTMRAEPGDKPIQRLEAMSGGEKSLTALAFIFAIQRYEPAPFYALDEIDAFLDAANAERVGEMVDELASNAQFIVVSHRSAMLERSERAIGVTMQDDNRSTVTGIDLAGQREVTADD